MINDTDFPHLDNAPITEALIDIQVRFHKPPTSETLLLVANSIKDEFPLREERHKATLSFNISTQESESSVVKDPDGFLLRTEDKKYAAQIMHDRFSFSHLAPYKDWATLSERADKIWSVYRDTTKPDRIVRIAVRFINRLLMPIPIEDFGDYFTKPIEIPDALPQGLANYMTRMVIPEPETNLIATVQQVLDGTAIDNQLPIIFDIDTFKAVDLAADDNEAISSTLNSLRDYKNRIFFRNLTQKAIDLYK